MLTRLLIVLTILIAGNVYWWVRYRQAETNRNIDGREREAQLDALQDRWVQFTCISILLIMLLAPLGNAVLQSQ
ncbi:hypothetical protein Fbal_2377 [Ferrimonas balearica DSM 9799]|uniref:Uncharacterized protein n=1 Tax=Ferrimonas balearica (strain DSM 9799 / CCM 4581 / KCTC 23876 / PAT) TaxID=550540 RepID=E1SM61_FERBD|nr:hypothetical protein [Ferrimonas balearica]MBY6019766.1 hypothetical protein [Halomonas denitrificans]ADN76579.1 hypothetical protein Fbal_2377 [Ferrimonas balearica DSM 9799]MBW3139480.1 hypothetical protein [Ferrimonas balearica]MBW3162926.1 hypothetical protein [Ferrimonas balearica]MBY5980624.1 hypothetical protein [Ferrimonas balearica]